MQTLTITDAKDFERKLNAIRIGYTRSLMEDGRILIALCGGRIGFIIDERRNLIEKPMMVLGEKAGMACGTLLFQGLKISVMDNGDVTLALLNSMGIVEGVFALRVSGKERRKR